MNNMWSFFFILSLTLFLTVQCQEDTSVRRNMVDESLKTQAVQAHPGGTAAINKACDTSPRKEVCLKVLNSNPDSKKSDLKQLTFIAIQAASSSAANASKFIQQDLGVNQDDLEPAVQKALSDCSTTYETVVAEVDDATDPLLSDTIDDQQVVMWIRGALDAVDTCDAGVKSQPGMVAKVAQKNREVRMLCNNALHIFRVYSKNK